MGKKRSTESRRSKSGTMVLSQKKVERLFWVRNKVPFQVAEFKNLGVFLTNVGKIEIDRRIGRASAVMRAGLSW